MLYIYDFVQNSNGKESLLLLALNRQNIVILDLVPGLEAHEIVHVSCGASHSMALNKWGQVYAWGSDHNGQLGLQVENYIQPVPKILRALASYHVIQIICGERHSIALTNSNISNNIY